MSAILEPQHLCPKCGDTRPLSEFKLRSRSQGRSPSWCKECWNRQDRTRRTRQRERDISECLRRIRIDTPPARVAALFHKATRRAGGLDAITHRFTQRLESSNLRIALPAVSLVLKLLAAQDH